MSDYPSKLTPEQLFEKMISKGIRFEHHTKEEIIEYLKDRNNYFRTASYRKNYEQYLEGEHNGKYINLDFSYLTELSTIDMHLRFLVMKMCLDIEHSLKVSFLSDITANEDEDGYSIVIKFLNRYKYVLTNIFLKSKSSYVDDLIKKYFEIAIDENNNVEFEKSTIKCPIWAFLEVISFGDFLNLYNFYCTDKRNLNYKKSLYSVKSIRNACAHNNCLIYDLRKGRTNPSHEITKFVSSIETIRKAERQTHLTRRPIYELTALLYVYNQVVCEPVRSIRLQELSELVDNRMIKHKDYFEKQDNILNSYNFFKKIVDFLTKTAYNVSDIKKQ